MVEGGSLATLIDQSEHLPKSALADKLFTVFSQMPALELVKSLYHLTDLVALRHSGAEHLLICFARQENLVDAIGYERLVKVYKNVTHDDDCFIQGLLLRSGAKDGLEKFLFEEEKMPSIAKALESFTLGERREFAKSTNSKYLQMLVYDNDYLVTRNLLSNAKMAEIDVLKMASRRPQSSQVLREIFMNERWSCRYEIRKALTLNPDTPKYIALTLINFLRPIEWKLITQMKNELTMGLVSRAMTLLDLQKNRN